MSGADTSHRDYVGLLYRTHHGWLQARLRRYPGSSSYAEDIAAETFTQLLSVGQGMSIREPRALLTTIARRLIYQRWRRRDVEQAYLMKMQHELALCSPSPEALAQAHQALQMIDALLDGLPQKVRNTFLLSRVNGLTYPEIAAQLGISRRSVSDYMSLALGRCLISDAALPKQSPFITRDSL
ncbi:MULTISPECIES: sigma-70 family RNA polymerase sigma factor [Pseudomonas]|jgi:RNA polymerase sigma-70 factor (ECF subfamily)|uniref:sigma-70 family RNA polymerase sigma factor n=1 Tax=Pseudomonas TaxID=286 RepID=UPI000287D06D|nr:MULTISPECIES: sigma-70 family RNA polymerase sigma factor [Pseudomonas]AMB78725.1 RNA polymerase subunit sigma [Pseudomonas fragi]MCB1656319.1 sigma-70 family RNA polymerase sigma factor [Pseudomonadales bacterium]NBF14213.1 sigma-70 family RNA polymerase sigma factor [Pseudomonas sp. Fl4BN2]NNG62934.1 sigma-70 family RNA polymerase sigma factor [Pseudomonas sp. GC01]AUB74407.1 RNA polymerase subunit sigma [Pseudomonas sp. Lz4W]